MKEDMEVVSKPKIREKKTEKYHYRQFVWNNNFGRNFLFYDKHREEKKYCKSWDVAKWFQFRIGC